MDKTLLDSIYGRRRKERELLAPLIPPRLPHWRRRLTVGGTSIGPSAPAAHDDRSSHPSLPVGSVLHGRPPAKVSGWVPSTSTAPVPPAVATPAESKKRGRGGQPLGQSAPPAGAAVIVGTTPTSRKPLVAPLAAAAGQARSKAATSKQHDDDATAAAGCRDDEFPMVRRKAANVASRRTTAGKAATPATANQDDNGRSGLLDRGDSDDDDDEEVLFPTSEGTARVEDDPAMQQASASVKELTGVAEIQALIASTRGSGSVSPKGPRRAVVICYSTWCPKCAKVVPQFLSAVQAFDAARRSAATAMPLVLFGSVDVERARGAAEALGVDDLPCVALFQDGGEVDRLAAVRATILEQKVTAFVTTALPPAAAAAASPKPLKARKAS